MCTGTFKHGRMRRILFFVILFCMASPGVFAENRETRLLLAGLELFPSFLAADLAIHKKQNADKELLLWLIHTNLPGKASKFAQGLGKTGAIRNLKVRAESLAVSALGSRGEECPAGIFLLQPMNGNLDSVLKYARKCRILVFSPYEEDVRRGVPAGIFVRSKIQPYINIKALQAADIHLKPFFLRVAKVVDD